MISKFTTVYPGHVDLPDRGQDATPANERRFSNDHRASVFSKTENIDRLLDKIGFDTIWLAEHHFQHEGYEVTPNLLMFAVHIAHITKKLRFGCGFNIAPMWHPLRLAEDFAAADIMTKGRTVFGVGRGYHTREVETFGAPMIDQNANRELIKEMTPFYEEHVKMFAPLGFMPGFTPEQVAASAKRGNWGAAGVPKLEDYMKSGAWIAGTPDDLIAHLKGFEERYPGLEYVNLSTSIGTPEAVMLEQFQWVAEAIMPAFQKR